MINQPTLFSSALTEDRLNVISRLLLDARYSALCDANTELDGAYTKGCLSFGRQRQIIINTWQNKQYHWLGMAHPGTDLIFKIGNVSVRFFTDNSNHPKKLRVLIPTQAEQLSIFDEDPSEVVLWRFIVEPARNDDDEDSVFFIGINNSDEIICRWKYGNDPFAVLHSIDNSTPPPKDLKSALVLPKTENDISRQVEDDV